MTNETRIAALKEHLNVLTDISNNNALDITLIDWLLTLRNHLYQTQLIEQFHAVEKIIDEYHMEHSICRYSESYIQKQYIAITKQFLTDLIYTLKLRNPCIVKNKKNILNKIFAPFQ